MPQASSEVAVHAPAMSAHSSAVDAAPVRCFALRGSQCFSIVVNSRAPPWCAVPTAGWGSMVPWPRAHMARIRPTSITFDNRPLQTREDLMTEECLNNVLCHA